MLNTYLRRCFSKVSSESVRLLRDQTGAPLLQCKNILTECEGDIEKAKAILREKNLIFAEKKAGANAGQGLWGFLASPDRKKAVLVNLNSETDFVAKGDDFKQFLSKSMGLLLNSNLNGTFKTGDNHIDGIIKDVKYDSSNTLEEMRKLMTAKTKEKVEFSYIQGIQVSSQELIGSYIHKELADNIGSSGCWVTVEHSGKGEDKLLHRLVDNLAIHFFGNKSEVFYESQIDKQQLEDELSKVKKELEKALKGKPEDLQQKMTRGKLMRFLGEKSMEHQRVGFMESEQTIGEHIAEVSKRTGSTLKVVRAERFGL